MSEVVTFCRSRNDGRRCTRPLGHAGLHRHRTIMWSDAGADPAHCSGSGEPGEPAAPLDDGFPDGRALCPVCLRFIPLDADSRLLAHDTADETETDVEASRRRDWLNAHGW
ncbi:hypothetical protein ASF40_07780 [Microbacterium sp. Leaf288]|uniref:hypothetical protein n=1 Tax=Microbacterium sp. Leaf288 TaxID=1736323 RepID=UPI000701B803|nr:hypothetical protein [Microbacterium sp. Leaf288]KQP71633.1 hypothetical protein ASF40_07780 [Microbacterium sp. Leaf288]